MSKVLVLGVTGMLGHAIYKVFSKEPRLSVFGTIRSQTPELLTSFANSSQIIPNIDVEDETCLKKVFDLVKPDVVVNCIGIIKQLADSEDVLKTVPINTLLPHRLAALAHSHSARLILISTDCVFSGIKGNYLEADFPDCDDLYGRSKLLGEISASQNVLTIRTSIIGHELRGGHSLVNWFLNQAGPISGYTKAIFSGLPTNELAKIILDCITLWPNLNGLYHISADPISKYDLLCEIAKIYGIKTQINPSDSLVIDRSLNHSKFSDATGYTSKPWTELIRSMHQFNLRE